MLRQRDFQACLSLVTLHHASLSSLSRELSRGLVFTAVTETTQPWRCRPCLSADLMVKGHSLGPRQEPLFCFLCAKCQAASAFKRLTLLSAVGKNSQSCYLHPESQAG